MEVRSSITELCLELINGAFQRCRVSEDICRLSIVLKISSIHSSVIRISISDTGIGSNLEEFQNLKCIKEAAVDIETQKWDGLLSVTTTGMNDSEIYYYALNLRESNGSSKRLTRLPSNPKNGAKFSGNEVCLSICESIDVLVLEINHFLQKIFILKIPTVVIELVVEREDIPESRCEIVFLANESNPLPFSCSNFERLKSGFEDYVLKHGHRLNQNCNSCFPTREHLKIGNGVACSMDSKRSTGLTMEVVITLSESAATCPCFSQFNTKTEVLYFEDFQPCSISNQLLNAFSSIDWKSYGMTLGNVDDQEGFLLEWENLPPNTHMAMVLHCYHEQVITPSARRKTQTNRCLIKKAVKLALDDLKERHIGTLLSGHAHKIRSYASELGRSIAGLILSSNDPGFEEECFSLLGLQTREIGEETVRDCIKDKIISVIDTNDGKSQRSKDMATGPFLFEDDCYWNSNFQEDQYEEGEDDSDDAFNYLY